MQQVRAITSITLGCHARLWQLQSGGRCLTPQQRQYAIPLGLEDGAESIRQVDRGLRGRCRA
jgi:hypothetical protein